MEALEALRTRRSYGRLRDPGPSDEQLQLMLSAAAAAPDHGELRPFRFTVLRGRGLDAFGEVLEQAYLRRSRLAGTTPVMARARKERTKLCRAPLVVVVAAKRQPSETIPWVDQRDAAVAAAQNILIAAHALGFGAMWRTGDACGDAVVKSALGLNVEDALIGFLYLGTPHERRPPRVISLDGLVSEYTTDGEVRWANPERSSDR